MKCVPIVKNQLDLSDYMFKRDSKCHYLIGNLLLQGG